MLGDFSIREKFLLVMMVLLLLGGVFWKVAPAVVSTLNPDRLADQSDLLPQEPAPEPEPEMITVHLVGEVLKPGIYCLPVGSRVYELLEAAGGASEDADTTSVNLARPLYDGEQVAIYRVGEAAADQAPSERKVNINKASAEELKPCLLSVKCARSGLSSTEKYGPLPISRRSWMSAASARYLQPDRRSDHHLLTFSI